MNGNCWLFVIHYSLFSMVIPIYQSTVNNEERTVAARFSNLCAKPTLLSRRPSNPKLRVAVSPHVISSVNRQGLKVFLRQFFLIMTL
jgi:hypothetical protein